MDLFDIALASQLSGGGGGGGSVNTANIVFRNRSTADAIDVSGAFNNIGVSVGVIRLLPNEPYTQSVFMSQNGAEIYIDPTQIPQNYAVNVSGSITDDGDGYYIVTGNGEIDIKTSK